MGFRLGLLAPRSNSRKTDVNMAPTRFDLMSEQGKDLADFALLLAFVWLGTSVMLAFNIGRWVSA